MAEFFHANLWVTDKIPKVKVTKWNETSVWLVNGRGKPQRKLRSTDKDFYSETYAEAKAWLVGYWTQRTKLAKELHEQSQEHLNAAVTKT